MRELVKMFVVLTILSAFSGGLLAAVRLGTKERIAYQQLTYVKGPAIRQVLAEASNDPIQDRFQIKDGDLEREFFVGVVDGKPKTVAFETKAKGFGGDIGLIVGVDLETDEVVGVAVTTHSETPGLGARAKDDPSFVAQFQGLPIDDPFQLRSEGGSIDALSGATITSNGVCAGVRAAAAIYKKLKPKLVQKAQAFVG